jgi:hypothetical protein
MKLTKLNKKVFAILLIPLISFAGGCEEENFDLKTAQKFGHQAENFETSYNGIIRDIYLSCLRKARFSSPITPKNPSDVLTREYFENQCLEFAQNEEALLDAHEVLAEYTKSFRELSSDKIINDLQGAKKLAEALAGLPIPALQEANSVFPLKQVAGELANAIQRALEDQYRQGILKDSVKGVNTSIQKYIATLAQITGEIYKNQLILEESQMNLYYAEVVRQELDKTQVERQTNPVQVSVLLVDKQWQEDRKEANFPEKFAKIQSYLITLKEMANLHQELYISVQESR